MVHQFIVTPSQLTFKTNTACSQTIKLDWPSTIPHVYIAGCGVFPPNVTVSFSRTPTKPQPITINYDPAMTTIVNTGQIAVEIKVGSTVFAETQSVWLPLEFEQKKTSTLLECSICCHDYDEGLHVPKMLTCGHTFCYECIYNIEKSGVDVYRRTNYACPIDRTPITMTCSQIPKNRLVCDLMQERKEKDAEEGRLRPIIVNNPYVPCFENELHESAVYCENCKEAFCKSCFTSIHTPKVMSGHKSVPVSQKPMVLPMCPLHPDMKASFICMKKKCETGHELCCHACVIKEHHNHPNKAIQLKIADNIETLEKTIDEMKSAEKCVQKRIREANECVYSFDSSGSAMRQIVRNITQNFEKKKEDALAELDTWARNKRMKIEDQRQKCETRLNDIQMVRRQAEQKLKRKTELHGACYETKWANLQITAFKNEEEKSLFYNLNEYTITDDMSEEPKSPIILDESPSNFVQGLLEEKPEIGPEDDPDFDLEAYLKEDAEPEAGREPEPEVEPRALFQPVLVAMPGEDPYEAMLLVRPEAMPVLEPEVGPEAGPMEPEPARLNDAVNSVGSDVLVLESDEEEEVEDEYEDEVDFEFDDDDDDDEDVDPENRVFVENYM